MRIEAPDFPTVPYRHSQVAELDLALLNEASTVAGLMIPADPVPVEQQCLKVLDMFLRDPDLASVPVVDAGRLPVGLVDRQTMVEIFLKPYTRDLYHRTTIRQFMNTEPVIVDVKTLVDDLAQMILDAGMRHMTSGYIITQNGLYMGMGSGHDLLQEITRRKQAHLYQLAHFDSLTGLPNRLLFADRFQNACLNAQRTGHAVALMFIDLDRFKFINDTLGHPSGDVLLKEVARRLVGSVRKSDTVARLGGDEFTIIVGNLSEAGDCALIADKVMASLKLPVPVLGTKIDVTASMGIALFPKDDASTEDLIRKADIALYKAKEEGRGRYVLYDEAMETSIFQRIGLEADLRQALERKEFALHYQPQQELASGRIVGVEALVRWWHPRLGLVSPAKFIPVAEETGLIVPLGEWVLREACRQQVAWRSLGYAGLRMAVNISGVQFQQPGFYDMVRQAIDESGIRPEDLELELTESMVMGYGDSMLNTLEGLRALGVKLALDDFGTGYSSLGYLRRFPLDRLKIDQCFIRHMDRIPANLAIVKAVIALGKTLDLQIIAEGIETDSELALIAASDCREIQGYHISRPLPANELLDWLQMRESCAPA